MVKGLFHGKSIKVEEADFVVWNGMGRGTQGAEGTEWEDIAACSVTSK